MEPEAHGVDFAITDEQGRAITDFVAVVSTGADTLRVSCPVDTDGARPLHCVAGGMRFEGDAEELSVTLKARPHGFARHHLHVSGLAREGHSRKATLRLPPAPSPEVHEHYATGFLSDGGYEAFRGLAFQQNTEMGPTELVKFYIDDLNGTPRVYFQNTRTQPLHYEFVTRVLGKTLTRSEFEARTYHGQERTAMAGSLVLYPSVEARSEALGGTVAAPMALTFFPSDDLTVSQAQQAHLLVEQALGFVALSGGTRRLVYVPAGAEQEADLAAHAQVLAASDSAWMRASELFGQSTLQILNPGVAFGTLRVLTPEQLASTVVSYRDVLVLTRLPNELPIVAGTITEERQTPLAHVNVAARTRGTPNISLLHATSDPQVAALREKLVRFEVSRHGYTLREATRAEAEQHWQSQARERQVPEFDLSLTGLPAFAELGFAHASSVGAKAANLAELQKVLGTRAPEGFAVPFSYFERHMNDHRVSAEACDLARAECVDEGRAEPLCQSAHGRCMASSEAQDSLSAYAERLLADAEFVTDTPLREACLDGLAWLVREAPLEPAFAAELDARVAELFGSDKVKLRSSTNAEDLRGFSGAGLYESQSAFASGEKAASLRIGDVYASVFAFRAFEERSYWNIDHRAIRMGVAVNRAIVDEQVNGVLVTQNIADTAVAGMYVNLQKGESPVTNPTDGSLPEIFSILPSPSGAVQAQHLRYSSLSPGEPLLSVDEVEALHEAASQVQRHFARLYGENERALALELELKFHGPERKLLIKQARPYATAH